MNVTIARLIVCAAAVASVAQDRKEAPRGIVALPNETGSVTVSWRLLGSDLRQIVRHALSTGRVVGR